MTGSAQGSRARPAFKSWDSYRTFAKGVQQEQRFAQNAESQKFLTALRKTSRGRLKRLQQGHVLCRAQIGHGWDPIYFDGEELDDSVPGPFKPERMVPDPQYVGDGRANPRGIAYMYLAEKMAGGATLEDAMHQSLDELDGVFTYVCVTGDALGVAKDELAAKPLVLYESDDLVALASEEIAIRAVIDREIETYDPYERQVLVWTR